MSANIIRIYISIYAYWSVYIIYYIFVWCTTSRDSYPDPFLPLMFCYFPLSYFFDILANLLSTFSFFSILLRLFCYSSHYRAHSLFFHYSFLWNQKLFTEILRKPFSSVSWHWKGRSGLPLEPWWLPVRKMHAWQDRITDPHNSRWNVHKAHCRALAETVAQL